MKKRMITTMVSLSLAGLLVGCSSQHPSPDVTPQTPDITQKPSDESKNQGITVNKVQYETVLEKDIPTPLKERIEDRKRTRGFLIYEGKDGLYIYVASGERNSGGYGIEVISVEDNEGVTNVFVEETAPPEGMMTTQALTYPSVVIKVTGTTDNVHVYKPSKDRQGEMIEAIK